jgi:hypothetical protein
VAEIPEEFETKEKIDLRIASLVLASVSFTWLGDRDSVTCLSSVNSLRSLTSESTLPPLLRFAQSALFSSLSNNEKTAHT